MANISVKWIGSSVLGLLGIIILVALIGYITTKDTALLELVKTFFWVVVAGVVIVTIIINLPRFLR